MGVTCSGWQLLACLGTVLLAVTCTARPSHAQDWWAIPPAESRLVFGEGKPFTGAWTFSGTGSGPMLCRTDLDEAIVQTNGWIGRMVVHSTSERCYYSGMSGVIATTEGWPEFRGQTLQPDASGSYSQGVTGGRWMRFQAQFRGRQATCFSWQTSGQRVRGSGFVCAPPGLVVTGLVGADIARRAGRVDDLLPEVTSPLPGSVAQR